MEQLQLWISSGRAGALEELQLWRSWSFGEAGALEGLELWRSWSSERAATLTELRLRGIGALDELRL